MQKPSDDKLRVILSSVLIFVLNQILFKVALSMGATNPEPQILWSNSVPIFLVKLCMLVLTVSAMLFAKKEMVWPYYLPFIVPTLTFMDANTGFFWSIIWMVFGIIPIWEFAANPDKENVTPEQEKVLKKNPAFKVVTLLWVPVQILTLIWSFYAVSRWNISIVNYILFSISIGFSTGILGINIAHELIHKDTEIEKLFGKILLVTVCYGHWYAEHLWGHHKHVSTPVDPATSKFGESFYSFFPRSFLGGIQSSWNIEKERAEKKNFNFWSYHNHFLVLNFCSLVMAIVVGLIFGAKSVGLFFIQSFTAFGLLEIVNYIEHYGLDREEISDEKGSKHFEPVTPMHSWNADARVSNFYLFKLQRHSDHHAYAGRRYQVLRSFEASPQMPTGYAGMVLLALFPPLWFMVMNPRVIKWNEQQKKLRSSPIQFPGLENTDKDM